MEAALVVPALGVFLSKMLNCSYYLETVKYSAITSKIAKPVPTVLLIQKVVLNARPEFHAPIVKDLKFIIVVFHQVQCISKDEKKSKTRW